MQNVKAILGKFCHTLLVADMDMRKIKNVVKKTCIEGRKICLLKDEKIKKTFEEKVVELVVVGVQDLYGRLRD